MDKLARYSSYVALTLVLGFFAFMSAASADSGLGWFSCEAGETAPTKYVLSSLFAFEYDYQTSGSESVPEKSASKMSAEEITDQIFSDLVDDSSRSEKFEPQAKAALGEQFQDQVRAKLGISCLSTPQATGPYDTRDDAEMQQSIIEGINVNLRLEFDGVDLELVTIPFTP